MGNASSKFDRCPSSKVILGNGPPDVIPDADEAN